MVSTLFSNSHPSLSSDVTRGRDDEGDAETTPRAQIFVCVRRTDTPM